MRGNHWFKYGNFDFAGGADRFSISIALPAPDVPCTIEARLDRQNGPVIASVRSINTESWDDFQVISSAVKNASGVHDVYITFTGPGSPGNIQWFRFTTARDAAARIDAVAYDDHRGIRLDGRGAALAFVDHGDWVRYADLEFSPANKFFIAEVGVPQEYAGKRITARLDSPDGQAIAELTVGATGDWNEFHFQSTELTQPVTGRRDLYLTFSGGPGVGNIASIQFASELPKIIKRPKPSLLRTILRSIPMPPSTQPAKSR